MTILSITKKLIIAFATILTIRDACAAAQNIQIVSPNLILDLNCSMRTPHLNTTSLSSNDLELASCEVIADGKAIGGIKFFKDKYAPICHNTPNNWDVLWQSNYNPFRFFAADRRQIVNEHEYTQCSIKNNK